MFSAARIQTIRKSKGFSQELLAEHSGVSLRTIQRVEQGETVPRGYTLQALAAALEVPLDAFTPEPAPAAPDPAPHDAALLPARETAEPTTREPAALRPDPEFVQLLNLSALSFLVLPFLNILVPLLLWRARRRSIRDVAEVGRRVVGFQVLWQAGCFGAYLLVVLGQGLAGRYFHVVWRGAFVAVFVLSYALNALTVAYYAWQLRQGRHDIYRIRL